jgi:hypothetical protein
MVPLGALFQEELMKTVRARSAVPAAASAKASALKRPAGFAPEPPAEVPDVETQMDRAARFGHRLEALAVKPSAPLSGGEVVQRQGSDDEGSDDEYKPPQPRKGAKKQDPNSVFKKGTYKKTATDLEYETAGGSKHSESFDPKALFRRSKTKDLSLAGPQYRNNATRTGVKLKISNPYGLSVGQSTLNQAVVSHNSPSWLGMRAGGSYGNSAETSGVHNSLVEKKEKNWRSEIESTSDKFDYETETQFEKISDNPRAEEIAKLMTNPKWQDPKRIKKRFKKISTKDPDAVRVVNEKRTLTGKLKGKRKSRTTNLGTDLYYGIPRRAYDPEAHRKYMDARGQDSESSDNELEPPKKKKKRK